VRRANGHRAMRRRSLTRALLVSFGQISMLSTCFDRAFDTRARL
jgi:hypothetical protein